MRDGLREALAQRAALVFAADAGAVRHVRDAPRATGMVMLVIESSVAALDRAMLIAALGPLAVELAPDTRIAALDLAESADPADAIAAACFLTDARSTTGQVLRIES